MPRLAAHERESSPESTMALNPHPIILTSASERRRAELLALAGLSQNRRPALSCIEGGWRWRAWLGAETAGGIVAMLLTAARQGS